MADVLYGVGARRNREYPYCAAITGDVWDLYLWWCTKNNERQISKSKFLQHIASKMPRARRWWRLPNSRTGEKMQDNIFSRPAPPPQGTPEMDFIGRRCLDSSRRCKTCETR
ncbi:hypothetical protein J4530_00290 [Neisseria subflava]|uniref:primase-like DNA-binding domain-containing protein n=1 Tax=Neisseria subflava TaxID=28449 RepID=UPI00202AA103|nr:hypothetical protein [Neisseria subflava]